MKSQKAKESVWDCEWKGTASYVHAEAGGKRAARLLRRLDHRGDRGPVQGRAGRRGLVSSANGYCAASSHQ
jgi:hypothetical protein